MGDLPPDSEPTYPNPISKTWAKQSITLDLTNVPPCFSLSRYLSPRSPLPSQSQQATSSPPLLTFTTHPSQTQPATDKSEPPQPKPNIHPAHLTALSLNEECRTWGYGRVFHLPLPSATSSLHRKGHRQLGHPTDLVYTPSIWSEKMKKEWDMGSWGDRLGSCEADKRRLSGLDSVIPICTWILGSGDNGGGDDDDYAEEEESVLSEEENLVTQFRRLSTASAQLGDPVKVIRAPGVEPFPEDEEQTNKHEQIGQTSADSRTLRSSSKPPAKSKAITYIRRTEDISRYILLYPSIGSQPLFAATHSFEDDRHCLITRTQPDQTESLRYSLNFYSDAILHPRGDGWEDKEILKIEDLDVRAGVAEEAYMASIRRAGNGDVVKML